MKYDVVVIGGGAGGYVAAIRASQRNLKTAIIEENLLGGTCLNKGCIPTKTYLRLSHLYHELLNGKENGILSENTGYDMERMKARKDDISTQLREGIEGLLQANGVDIYPHRAKITDVGAIQLNDEKETVLQATDIILATGAKPFVPNIPGVELKNVVTSDELLENTENLDSLLIIGGGVIGVEMASVYSNLGVQVTIIEAMDRILPPMEREIGQSLAMSLKKQGVTIHAGAKVSEIKETGGQLEVIFDSKKGQNSASAQKVLIAIGRTAETNELVSENLNLEVNRGIVVNENFQTSIEHIYAIGDCVAGNIQLAHMASAQAANVIDIITGKKPSMNLELVPACVYTSPQIATVGLSETQAKEKGIEVKSSKYLTTANAKTIIEELDRGFVKLVFDAQSNVLLGAQLMCGNATDIISQLTLAIGKEVTAEEIESFIQPHPTFSEGILEAAENFFNQAIHIAPAKKRIRKEKEPV